MFISRFIASSKQQTKTTRCSCVMDKQKEEDLAASSKVKETNKRRKCANTEQIVPSVLAESYSPQSNVLDPTQRKVAVSEVDEKQKELLKQQLKYNARLDYLKEYQLF